MPTEELLIDRAQLLGLSAPEMTVLLGGLRVLGANYDGAEHGVLTDRKGQLTNDFFVNLLDIRHLLEAGRRQRRRGIRRLRPRRADRRSGRRRAPISIFGSNTQLRATAEVYAETRSEEKFVRDFVKAWTKVMDADRFDLRSRKVAGRAPAFANRNWRSRQGRRALRLHAGSNAGALSIAAVGNDVARRSGAASSASSWNSLSRGLERRQISAMRR